jgi:tetratricopeptide (TPR) repeat protein
MSTESAERLFEAALEAGRQRDYPEAIRLLEEVLCTTDRIPQALLYLGRSLHALGEYSRAVQAFQFYLKSGSDTPQGHFFIGRSYLSLGMHKQALIHLKRSLELDADSAPTLGLMGLALMRSGKSKAAVGFFEQALKLNPDQPRLFNGYLNALLTYAIRLFRHGKFGEAGKLFRFILEHRENSLIARLYLGSIYREEGQDLLALKQYEHAARLAPDDPVLHLQTAFIRLRQGDNEAALDQLNQALNLLGKNAGGLSDPQSLLRFMTMVLFQNDRYRDAISTGRRVLKHSYRDAEMHALLAECYRHVGELEKSRNHYQRALESDRYKLEYNYGLIAALWQSEAFDDLVPVLRRILKVNPEDVYAGYYQALVLPRLGYAAEDTIPLIQAQIRVQGPDPHLMCALGQEYLRANLPELAEGWFQRTLKRIENHREALTALLEVYRASDRKKDSRRTYDLYLKHYPEDQDMRREFIPLLYELGSYRAASREIVRLLPHEPDNTRLKKMLAACYRKTKQYREAIILFKELLQENPRSLDMLRSLVFCLEESAQPGTAIQLLEKARAFFRNEARLLLPLGVLYFKQNELEKAAAVFRDVVSLPKKISPDELWKAYRNLGLVYRRSGSPEFAEKFLRRAAEIKPDRSEILS